MSQKEVHSSLKMFGNAAASNAVRCAWNRFIPQGKPFVGILRKSISTVNRPQPNGTARPKILCNRSHQDGLNLVSKRTIQQSPPKDEGNTVLLVGLGALGVATFASIKLNIFAPESKQPERGPVQQKGSSEVESAEESAFEEEIVEEGSDQAAELENDIEGTPPVAEDITETTESVGEVQVEEVVQESEAEKSISSEEKVEEPAAQAEPSGEAQENKPKEEAEVDKTVSKEEAAEEKKGEEPKIPDLPKVPTHAPYVIIGGGTASHAACRAIRKRDPTAKILVIGEEEVLPYMRPPLSKELWFSEDEDTADTLFFKQWNGKKRSLFFEDDTFYVKPQLLPLQDNGGIAVLTGHKVLEIDPVEHKLHLKHGAEVKYDKLLIATGGHPKNHKIFEDATDDLKSKVTLFRTVADYRHLEKVVKSLDSVAIIGGGFLGSELACALGSKGKKNGMQVSQIYHEGGNMGKVLPNYLSDWTMKKVQHEGVITHPNAQLSNAILTDNGKVKLELSNGESIEAGHVIVCIGIEPNTELASSAGLEIDPEQGGFRVNSELQARSDIWVAGDAACFYDVKLGRRRVEHHDHAVVSGRLAGENMTGGKKSYLHQSMFWSDLGPDVGYEAIGIVDNTLDTVGVWAKATKEDSPKAVVEATGENIRSATEADAESGEAVTPVVAAQEEQNEEFGKGIVFYLKDEVVVGILLWNVFNKMPVARKILKDGKKQDSLVELAKLFNIHD